MKNVKNESENHPITSFTRQPIFDNKRKLWGYKLISIGLTDMESDDSSVGKNLSGSLSSGITIGLQKIFDSGIKILVRFNEKGLSEHLPYALPSGVTVVMITEDVCAGTSVLDMLIKLKSDGYLIAVDRFTGNPSFESIYRLADVIVIHVLTQPMHSISALLEKASPYDALILADRVGDASQYKKCRVMDFSLFHGPFFKSPDEVTTRKLSSLEISRFNLLRYIEQNQPDFTQLAKTIQTDVSISFRLLTHLNSVAFGFPAKIQSVHQAIMLLGWQKMKNWLRVVLLSDMSQRMDASELVLLSAQRGKFLEGIARDHDYWGFEPEELHMLGIFSLLDALLGLPMADIVAHLPMDRKFKSALCRHTNNEYLPLLYLVQHIEDARWLEADKMIRQLNLHPEKVASAFQTAVDWAVELGAMQKD